MTPAELLGSTEVFSSSPGNHIEQIATRLVRQEFAEGADLVVQADPRAGYKVMRVLGPILSTCLREANRALAG